MSEDEHVTHQEYYDGAVSHKGKCIRTAHGQSGYVDWTGAYGAFNGHKTARLFVSREHNHIDIEVAEEKRGHGRKLLEIVARHAAQDGYDDLLILGATEIAREFYRKVLMRLEKEGKGFLSALEKRSGGDYTIRFRLKK